MDTSKEDESLSTGLITKNGAPNSPTSEKPGGDSENEKHPGGSDSATSTTPAIVPRAYKRRWVMVTLFAVYSMSNAYQWIHLNIIGNVIARYYNASLPGGAYQQEVAIHWLSMVYMLAYIPLIFPATWLLDTRGLRIIGILGSLLNAVGAWVKVLSVSPHRFGVLMLGQTVCAVAQIFILGLPARLAAVWFGPNEVSTATAIGVFGNQIGCAIGFLLPPELVPNHPSLDVVGQHLSYMYYGGAGFTTLLFILVLVLFQNGPPVPPSQAQAAAVQSASSQQYIPSLLRLFKNKGFLILMATYGANTGSYYAIGTLLNPIVIYYYPGEELNAGRIGLTLVVAGVAGSIIAGIWLDKTKLFKYTTVGIYLMTFGGMLLFTLTLPVGQMWIVFLCGGLLGFFMTGYLPVGFEFAAEITYPESEGTSSGLLNASAQIFGIILTLGMSALMKHGMLAANLVLCVTLLLGTLATGFIPSDLRRQKAGEGLITAAEKESLTIKVDANSPPSAEETKI